MQEKQTLFVQENTGRVRDVKSFSSRFIFNQIHSSLLNKTNILDLEIFFQILLPAAFIL